MTKKKKEIVDQVRRLLKLEYAHADPNEPFLADAKGKLYYVKYRTEIDKGILSFDFKEPERAIPFDFFLGVFCDKQQIVTNIIRIRKVNMDALYNNNSGSWRIRWNETNRDDARIELLKF